MDCLVQVDPEIRTHLKDVDRILANFVCMILCLIVRAHWSRVITFGVTSLVVIPCHTDTDD